MDFSLTAEQAQFQESVRRFAELVFDRPFPQKPRRAAAAD